MNYIDIYIEDPFLHNETLTYHHDEFLECGIRVWVTVGNSLRIGFVKESHTRSVDFETKAIKEVIDQEPIINEELLELGQWMAKTTLNPIIRCFQAILPNQLRPSSSFRNKQKIIMLKVKDYSLATTKKQQEALDGIGEGMSLTKANSKYKSIVSTLEKKGALERYEEEKMYDPKSIEIKKSHLQLTRDQQNVLNKIDLDTTVTYLLHGITGSGKTEIYLQVAENVLSLRKQVLVLVPEISLTPQMISRFQQRFGQDIGIYHSGLNAQEKYEQYVRVQKEEVSIVVGTRSAVFLPFHNLGLIVMDEEHDDSFKQESTPFYHARDIALKRSNYHQCPLILGSASPSLESYARAYKGVYQLLELPNRINNSLPQIHLIDTSSSLRNLNYEPVSRQLISALKENLKQNQQSMLLLNRRSYAPVMKCGHCGHVLMCPNCDTTLAFHKEDNVYRCHTCDYVSHQRNCIECGHEVLEMRGLGTQRLEEIIQKALPSARISRMDRDTTQRKNAHQKLLNEFNAQQKDILIGTQMISKGLDNPNVTCVGILNPDSALLHEDFSSAERVFALILQASGRAGRHELEGHVYIQTFNPEHYTIKYAIKQDYKSFFNQEMKYRHMGQYPPYSYLIEIIFSHKNEESLQEVVRKYQLQLMESSYFTTLGPAMLRKRQQKLRGRIILKGKDLEEMTSTLNRIHQQNIRNLKGVNITINVNPNSIAS